MRVPIMSQQLIGARKVLILFKQTIFFLRHGVTIRETKLENDDLKKINIGHTQSPDQFLFERGDDALLDVLLCKPGVVGAIGNAINGA